VRRIITPCGLYYFNVGEVYWLGDIFSLFNYHYSGQNLRNLNWRFVGKASDRFTQYRRQSIYSCLFNYCWITFKEICVLVFLVWLIRKHAVTSLAWLRYLKLTRYLQRACSHLVDQLQVRSIRRTVELPHSVEFRRTNQSHSDQNIHTHPQNPHWLMVVAIISLPPNHDKP
jgi:hypothetical protein